MNIPYSPSSGVFGALKRRMTRLQARKTMDCTKGRRIVSFSFDDFPRSAAQIGAQTLENYGWRGTYYTSTGFESTKNHLGPLFTAQDVARLVSKGHEIGCHTENHVDCALNPPVVVEREIRQNQKRLRALGAPTPRTFAYPFGEASAHSKALLGQHYACLRGVKNGINRRFADAHQLYATALEGGLDDKALALSFVDDLAKAPGWLIFYSHDISPNPGEWGCTPELLQAVCEAVKMAGFEVLPIIEAYSQLELLEKAA